MERERITITIKKDLLRQVDQTIDGSTIRNRSHAIESLLSQSLGSQLGTAVILAGGKGLKLRPFTYELPKPMIPVGGKPILEHILDLLRTHRITNVILLTGYLGEKIEEHFGDGRKFGVHIHYAREAQPLGTAGALATVSSLVGSQSFFVINGDILVDINLTELAEFHQEHGRLATMSLTSVSDPSDYGSVKLSGTRIVAFDQQAGDAPSVSRLINAGVYVLSPEVLEMIPPSSSKQPIFLEETIFPALIERDQLTGYLFDGPWFDISTPETYERALKEWVRPLVD